jgi:tetratricopeptide (TPR) repeat protein
MRTPLFSRGRVEKWSRFGLLALLLSSVGALAQNLPESRPLADRPDPFPSATPEVKLPVGAGKSDDQVVRGNAADQILGLMTAAKKAAAEQRWDDAESAYHQIMRLAVPDIDKRKAMIQMGEMFEQAHAYAKAVLIYDEFLERFRDDPVAGEISLHLGRDCRELGAFKTALNHFYDALHSSLSLNKDQQKIALRAQFEIAETHFVTGDYAEAQRYFQRLVLLEMSPDDLALVQFQLADATYLAGNYAEAIALGRKFVSDHPDAPQVPETRYLLSRALQKLGRSDDAALETLALLKDTKTRDAGNAQIWQRWQLRTGKEVASELYDRGDVMNALAIYQKLAEIDVTPQGRLPIVYQIGLCFERLRMVGKALQAYTYIKDAKVDQPATTTPEQDPISMVKDMAKWRIGYLRWSTDTDRELGALLKPDWNTANLSPLQFRDTPLQQTVSAAATP